MVQRISELGILCRLSYIFLIMRSDQFSEQSLSYCQPAAISHLVYGLQLMKHTIFWAPCLKTVVAELIVPKSTNKKVIQEQRMQNLSNLYARFVFKTSKYWPVTVDRYSLGFLTYCNVRKYHSLCPLHILLHEKHSSYLKELILKQRSTSECLRSAHVLRIPWFRNDFVQKSYLVKAIRAWNKLLTFIQAIRPHSSYRYALKWHLRNSNATVSVFSVFLCGT